MTERKENDTTTIKRRTTAANSGLGRIITVRAPFARPMDLSTTC